MTHQPAEAEWKRNDDIRRADEGADDDWRDAALTAIKVVAKTMVEFTTDDVMAVDPELERAREPRALGPTMLRAAREGWIEPTDRYAPSKRKQSNLRPKRVWRSLLFPGAPPGRQEQLDIVQGVLL